MKTQDRGIKNYIKMSRDIPEWLMKDKNAFVLLRTIALRARREAGYVYYNGENIWLDVNQALVGRRTTAQENGLSEREYRTAYDHLLKTGQISTIRTTHRYTICLLLSDVIFDINPTTDSPTDRPNNVPEASTNKNDKNEKNKNSSMQFEKFSEHDSPILTYVHETILAHRSDITNRQAYAQSVASSLAEKILAQKEALLDPQDDHLKSRAFKARAELGLEPDCNLPVRIKSEWSDADKLFYAIDHSYGAEYLKEAGII